ncbi:MAG: uracil-DNA glycosylase family protein [Cyclobacteriaceae bacterium]
MGPRPIVQFSAKSRIVVIGQAPGVRVHTSGVPWDDPSGNELRRWLGVTKEQFYDPDLFALVPMGFCYPGKGKSGDSPPRPECAPQWHDLILKRLKKVEMTLLIGQYAQQRYLGDRLKPTLTETVKNFKNYLPDYLPLVHPSPRNRIWMKKNPWFERMVIPGLQRSVRALV